MEVIALSRYTSILSVPTCAHMYTCHIRTILPLFTRQAVDCTPVSYLFASLLLYCNISFRRDIGMRPVGRRKYRHCSRYCKCRNGIITLSLYCTQSRARRGFGPTPSALFAGSFAWWTRSEYKNSARYIEPFDRSLCVLVWPVTSQRTSIRGWLLNLLSRRRRW